MSKKILKYGSGLVIGSFTVDKVAKLCPSGTNINRTAQSAFGISSVAMPVQATKGLLDNVKRIYK